MGNWLSNAYNNYIRPAALWAANTGMGRTLQSWFGIDKGNQGPTEKPHPEDKPLFDIGAFAAELDRKYGQTGGSSYQKQSIPDYGKTFNDFWNEGEARSKATAEYDPYYAKKQSELAAKTETSRTRAEEDYTIGTKLEQESLDRYLEQAGITTDRAKQDAKIALAQIAADRGETRAETAYDRVRQNRALVDELKSKGTIFGGMAKQAGGEASKGRQLVENKLTRQYNAAEAATALTEGRQIEDVGLATKNRKAESKASLANLALGKKRTLEDLARTQSEESAALEEERKYKIENAVNQRWQQAYDSWDMDFKQFMAKYGY